jgi:hypothetical protein
MGHAAVVEGVEAGDGRDPALPRHLRAHARSHQPQCRAQAMRVRERTPLTDVPGRAIKGHGGVEVWLCHSCSQRVSRSPPQHTPISFKENTTEQSKPHTSHSGVHVAHREFE